MQLRYIGPVPETVGGVPLPEGWPAADHEEPDEEIAAAKLEFRLKGSRVADDGTVETVWGGPAYAQGATGGEVTLSGTGDTAATAATVAAAAAAAAAADADGEG